MVNLLQSDIVPIHTHDYNNSRLGYQMFLFMEKSRWKQNIITKYTITIFLHFLDKLHLNTFGFSNKTFVYPKNQVNEENVCGLPPLHMVSLDNKYNNHSHNRGFHLRLLISFCFVMVLYTWKHGYKHNDIMCLFNWWRLGNNKQ